MRAPRSGEVYVCEHCRGEFVSEWSDEEAIAEMDELWGELADGEQAVICDDCFWALIGGTTS